MKLIDLDPKWLSSGGEGISDSNGNPVPVTEKTALNFGCPCGCGAEITLPVINGFGHRWEVAGQDFNFNTITITPSIQRTTGCKIHFFITNGEIING